MTTCVTYYGYQPDGVKSAHYTTLGKYNPSTGVMTGYFAASENGQCYGCSPRSPQLTDLGEVRFEFTSRTTGRMRLPGVAAPIDIVRSVLRVGNTWEDRQELYGVWHIVDAGLTTYFGEALWFQNESASVANGFNGVRWGTTRLLVGGPMSSSSAWSVSVLVDFSASYYSFYAFVPSGNGWVGRNWTYLKTSQLSGSGLVSMGFKTLGKQFALAGASTASADGVSEEASEANAEARFLAGSTGDAELTGVVKIGDTVVSLAELAAHAAELQMKLESQR